MDTIPRSASDIFYLERRYFPMRMEGESELQKVIDFLSSFGCREFSIHEESNRVSCRITRDLSTSSDLTSGILTYFWRGTPAFQVFWPTGRREGFIRRLTTKGIADETES